VDPLDRSLRTGCGAVVIVAVGDADAGA